MPHKSFLLVSAVVSIVLLENGCQSYDKYINWTLFSPQYDCNHSEAIIAVNETFQVYLYLGPKEDPMILRNISFYANETRIDAVTILNATHVVLRKTWTKPSINNIVCRYNDGISGKSRRINGFPVVVDTAPGQLTAINCTSQTMKRIDCEAKLPPHFADLTSSVEWGLRSDQTDRRVNSTLGADKLVWSIDKEDMNMVNARELFFKVNLTNFLNTSSVEHKFDRQFSVYADKPLLELDCLPATGVTLRWNTSADMLPLLKGMSLHYLLEYRSEYAANWTFVQIFSDNASHMEFALKLPQDYANYTISLRASTRPDMPTFWSERATGWCRTAANDPVRSPQPAPGAFYIDHTNTTTIYWSAIGVSERRGTSVRYRLYDSDGLYNCTVPDGSTKVTGKCRASKADNPTSAVHMNVQSHNPNRLPGNPPAPAVLIIPDSRDRLPPPALLSVLEFPATAKTNRTREFVWMPSEDMAPEHKIVNYTVVMCKDGMDTGTDCNANLYSTIVPAHQTNFTLIGDGTVRFAVAANSAHSTSGLRWTECQFWRRPNGDDSQYYTTKVRNITDHSVQLTFPDQCLGHFRNLSISHCVVADANSSDCLRAPKQQLNIAMPQKSYTVTGLLPDHYYLFSLNASLRHSGEWLPFSRPFVSKTGPYVRSDGTVSAVEVLIICAVTSVLSGLVLCAGIMSYQKVQNMRRCEVKMPPGLESTETTKEHAKPLCELHQTNQQRQKRLQDISDRMLQTITAKQVDERLKPWNAERQEFGYVHLSVVAGTTTLVDTIHGVTESAVSDRQDTNVASNGYVIYPRFKQWVERQIRRTYSND